MPTVLKKNAFIKNDKLLYRMPCATTAVSYRLCIQHIFKNIDSWINVRI